MSKKEISTKQSDELFKTLEARFIKNKNCHEGIEWLKVKEKLEANPEKICSLTLKLTNHELTFNKITPFRVPLNLSVDPIS